MTTILTLARGRYALLSHNCNNPVASPMPVPQCRRSSVSKRPLRLDDEVRFIRSWIKKPLAVGAVTPSGQVLARTMARYVDPEWRLVRWSSSAPAPGRSPRRWSSTASQPARLVLVEFNPTFCQLLRAALSARRPWCRATPIGCAVACRLRAPGRRRRVRPAADDQAAAHARAAAARGARAAARRARRSCSSPTRWCRRSRSSPASRSRPPSASG